MIIKEKIEMKIISRKNKLLCFTSVLLFILLASSCSQNEAYFQYRELKNAEWERYDTLYFEIDSIQSSGLHTVYLEVTNNVNYPYQNLWLFAQDNFTDSTYVEHKIECRLADESGKWLGSGFGSLYQTSFVYRGNIVFSPERKDYRVKIVHGMRDEVLTGIERIGVKIIKED